MRDVANFIAAPVMQIRTHADWPHAALRRSITQVAVSF